jgi:hypothetical protein
MIKIATLSILALFSSLQVKPEALSNAHNLPIK